VARRRPILLFALLGALQLLLTVGCAERTVQIGVPHTPPGWTLTFEEDFDGPVGAAPDQLRWLHDVGGVGWGDKQLQYYTDSTENSYLDGSGNMAITARQTSSSHPCWYGPCHYTSARIVTHQSDRSTFAQAFGRVEARIKMPAGKGLWPSFWLLGDNIDDVGWPGCGEIDIMEVLGSKPDEIQQHAHGPGLDMGGATKLPPGESITDWHTYAINWTDDRIDWLVDGRVTSSMTKQQADGGWVFDHPFFITLNLAVGGGWPGDPDNATVFPATMLVDYVRAYTTEESAG
jgi:beta-glucanase (GH16 family)